MSTTPPQAPPPPSGAPPSPWSAPPYSYSAPPPRKSRTGLWVGLGIGAVLLVFVVIGSCVALVRRGVSNSTFQACIYVQAVERVDGIVLQLNEGRVTRETALAKLRSVDASLQGQTTASRVFGGDESDRDAARVDAALEGVRSAVALGGDTGVARASLYEAVGDMSACTPGAGFTRQP